MSCPRPLSRARSLTAWPEDLFATTAAKIHPVLSAVTTVIVAEPLIHTRVIVSHALAMFGSMLPVVADVIDIDGPVYVNVVAAPIDAAAPIVSA